MGKFSLSAKSGIVGLTVLKTTGSNFVGFHTCPLTTLKEATDRIFSTTIEAFWVYPLKEITFFSGFPYSKSRSGVRQLILDLFANHNSPSVQNTLYLICEEALVMFPFLDKMEIALPNIHYWTFDLERFGIKHNGTPGKGGVFSPQADPNGVIKAVINRNKAKL
jgi:urate oxidase